MVKPPCTKRQAGLRRPHPPRGLQRTARTNLTCRCPLQLSRVCQERSGDRNQGAIVTRLWDLNRIRARAHGFGARRGVDEPLRQAGDHLPPGAGRMASCPDGAPGGTVDRPGEQTPSSVRLGERRVRTAGQSIDRPGTTGSRVQALNQRSIAPPATSNMTVGQGPYRPEPRQGKNEQPHAYAYIPFVRRRTICIDSPDAPALDGHQALLPDQRLHELPRAAPGARRRRLPRVPVQPQARLIQRATDLEIGRPTS